MAPSAETARARAIFLAGAGIPLSLLVLLLTWSADRQLVEGKIGFPLGCSAVPLALLAAAVCLLPRGRRLWVALGAMPAVAACAFAIALQTEWGLRSYAVWAHRSGHWQSWRLVEDSYRPDLGPALLRDPGMLDRRLADSAPSLDAADDWPHNDLGLLLFAALDLQGRSLDEPWAAGRNADGWLLAAMIRETSDYGAWHDAAWLRRELGVPDDPGARDEFLPADWARSHLGRILREAGAKPARNLLNAVVGIAAARPDTAPREELDDALRGWVEASPRRTALEPVLAARTALGRLVNATGREGILRASLHLPDDLTDSDRREVEGALAALFGSLGVRRVDGDAVRIRVTAEGRCFRLAWHDVVDCSRSVPRKRTVTRTRIVGGRSVVETREETEYVREPRYESRAFDGAVRLPVIAVTIEGGAETVRFEALPFADVVPCAQTPDVPILDLCGPMIESAPAGSTPGIPRGCVLSAETLRWGLRRS